MIDDFNDFDARRIGWWARRGAVRRIRRSTAITEADRQLRVQQAQAAQTKGEINVLVRGLSSAGPAPARTSPPAEVRMPPPGWPVTSWAPPRQPSPQQHPPQQPSPTLPAAVRPPPVPAPFAQQPAARKKSARGPLLIGLVIGLLMCGGGLVSCVSSVVDGVQSVSSTSRSAPVPDPQTADGWTAMIDAFDDQADLSTTVGLLVRRRAATVTVDTGDPAAARYYFDGDVTSAGEVPLAATERRFDLSDLDAPLVQDAVARARRSSGASASDEAWVQVSAGGSGPRIVVAFPTGASDTYALVVDADGRVVSETP